MLRDDGRVKGGGEQSLQEGRTALAPDCGNLSGEVLGGGLKRNGIPRPGTEKQLPTFPSLKRADNLLLFVGMSGGGSAAGM
jgi:hypothetical protein